MMRWLGLGRRSLPVKTIASQVRRPDLGGQGDDDAVGVHQSSQAEALREDLACLALSCSCVTLALALAVRCFCLSFVNFTNETKGPSTSRSPSVSQGGGDARQAQGWRGGDRSE